jgi:RNA polymerase sigma-70 factor (ECF subfamily)
MEEKSYQEIAEMLDLPLGTVKAHIFRARELLYKHLKDREGSF